MLLLATYMCVCIYIYIYIYIYMYIHVHTYVHMYIISYTHITCTYIYIYLYRERERYTYIHTLYIHTPAKKSSTDFRPYPLIIRKCYTNCVGHGHGYECNSPEKKYLQLYPALRDTVCRCIRARNSAPCHCRTSHTCCLR